MGPLSCCSPKEELPWLPPHPPGLSPPPQRLAGSSCCLRPLPQAHLLPGHPLSMLLTPGLLGVLSLWLAQHNAAWLAVCYRPGGVFHSPPCWGPHSGPGVRRAGGLFTRTLPHGWRVRGAHLVYLGTPSVPTQGAERGFAVVAGGPGYPLGPVTRPHPRKVGHWAALSGGSSSPWSRWVGAQRARGRRGPGRLPPHFDDQASALCAAPTACSSVSGWERRKPFSKWEREPAPA